MNNQLNTPFPAVTEGTIGDAVVQTVNARDLHAFLGVGKVFAAWIVDRIGTYHFNENSDFVIFAGICENLTSEADGSLSETGKRTRGGQNRKEYALTIDMAKELAMVERNEKGKAVRRYFIECERKAKEAAKAKAEIDFSDPVVALGVFEHMKGQIERAKAKIVELLPKAEALSKIAISDGSLCITDAAKTLQIQPKWFFKWLREHDWIYGRVGNSHDVGYQAKIQAGYLEHKVTSVYRSDGTEKTVTQVRVTAKGLAKLGELLAPKPPEGGAPAQTGTLFGIVLAGMLALGILAEPQPAKALPAPNCEGVAVLRIDGQTVTVDMRRFKVGPNDRVVRLHRDGRVDIGTVRVDGTPNWYGARGAQEPWRAPGPNMPVGTLRASDTVQVLGMVV